MATTTATYTYRLTAVYDLRKWDEGLECYIDVPADEMNQCQRCGRLHNKVYEVTRVQDGTVFTVGSTCCKKLFGWEPDKEEVRRLAKEAEKLAKNCAHQKLVDIATPIAEEVAALAVPEIVYLGTKYSRQTPCYGMANSGVEVLCHEGLTEERRQCCISAWKQEQVDARLLVLYPKTSLLMREDANWRKREKIRRIIRDLLNLW